VRHAGARVGERAARAWSGDLAPATWDSCLTLFVDPTNFIFVGAVVQVGVQRGAVARAGGAEASGRPQTALAEWRSRNRPAGIS
jgi:hypothetical protein